MYPPAFVLLYLPVLAWVGTGFGLMIAFRRSAPPVVLRLAATFLALWALLATTTLVWVLSNGGWTAIVRLASAPWQMFNPRYAVLWLEGTVGAFLVLTVAFTINQLVGRGFLRVLRPTPMAWPVRLPRPRERTSLLVFPSDAPQAFSFTLLEFSGSARALFARREIILLSRGLLARLDPDEREAAVAHELGHVRGLDSRYLTFLRTFSRMMRWDPLLAYLAATLTRREEYRADYEAARITRNPLALARALYKVSTYSSNGPPGANAFLGASGSHGRREALERIRRLVELSETPEFSEAAGA